MNILKTSASSLLLISAALWPAASPAAAAGEGAAAAKPEVWLGAALPAQRQQQREQRFAQKYLALGVQPAGTPLAVKDDPYPHIRGEALMQTVRDIVAISAQSKADGNTLWGRISGGPYERMTAEYLAQQFKAAGLQNVAIETFPRAPQPWPLSWGVTLIADAAYGAETRDHRFDLAFPSSDHHSTAADGIEAELVYVGLGTPADLAGRDLKGRIAVVHSVLQQSTFAHTAVGVPARLEKAGAAGVLTVMEVPGAVQLKPFGLHCENIPCFVLNQDDGRFLEELIAKAGAVKPARMRLALKTEEKTGWVAQNVLGVIPGSSDETVVLTAHMDSFFYGASDNASGIANLLELARHFNRKGAPRPTRSLLFVGTSGHHVHDKQDGSYSNGVINFMQRHAGVMDKTVFVFNAEHPGAQHTVAQRELVTGEPWASTNSLENPLLVAVSNRSPALLRALTAAIGRYQIPVITHSNHYPVGDAIPFHLAGVPVVNLITSGTWYHSSGDTPETLSGRGLERFTRSMASFLEAIDALPRAELEKDARSLLKKAVQK